jgi:hypothetical protein
MRKGEGGEEYSHSDIEHGLMSSGIRRYVFAWVVPDVSKERVALILKAQAVEYESQTSHFIQYLKEQHNVNIES